MKKRESKKPLYLLIITFYISSFLLSCDSQNSENQPLKKQKNEFIGAQSCQSCHQKEYKEWLGSHHDWAMKLPNSNTVLGDFNNSEIVIDQIAYHFFTTETSYYVKIKEPDQPSNTYKVKHTFGVHPLQQYLIETNKGRVQTLRASWDVLKKKWFHQYSGEQIKKTDWLHWTKGGQRWNTMCAECHSTNLKKNYDLETDGYSTSFSEINVACESCHGPGSFHVKNHKNKLLNLHSQQDELNTCAPCHSRRMKITENYSPNSTYDQQFLIQNINNTYYEADGQIKEEDYVYGSFLQSKMHAEGVKCTDCHNPHTLQLKATGNQLCLNCHAPSYNTKTHHKHSLGTEGAQCVNCHMTGKTFMGNDFRRDHSFRIPRPDQSIKFGTPNACNQCHTNKSNSWAAKAIVSWHGPNREEHFSDYLTLTSSQKLIDKNVERILVGVQNTDFPPIARAAMLDQIDINTQEAFQNINYTLLKDSSHLIRYSALSKYLNASPEIRLNLAKTYLFDISKIMRITSAKLILDLPKHQLSQNELNQFNIAEQELKVMLKTNADFPLGRLQLGDYYFKKSLYHEAIKHYEMALLMDSLTQPVYSNLATSYSIVGANKKAKNILLKANSMFNNSNEYAYLLALLYYEEGKPKIAKMYFLESIKLNPKHYKSHYNLAILYYQEQKIAKAKSSILKALQILPESVEAVQLKELLKE